MILAMPTKSGILLILASLAAVGSAIMNVGFATAMIASLLCAVTLAGFVLAQFSLHGITLSRTRPRDAVCGEPFDLPLTAVNRTYFYRMPLVVSEKLPFCRGGAFDAVIPALAPKSSVGVERQIIPLKRGHFPLKTIRLVSGDPCGLFWKSRRFDLPAHVTVSPKIEPLERLSLRNDRRAGSDQDGRPLGHAGSGMDFFGVRPYHPGDEMRAIHWKSSAAKGCIMVKEFEATTVDRIMLILDSNGESIGYDDIENNFEYLITAAASITDFLSRKYCALTFFTASEDCGILRENGDAAGIRLKIMEILTDLQPSKSRVEDLVADAMENFPDGAMVYVLTMSGSKELSELLKLMEDQGHCVRWVFAPKQHFPPCEPDEPRRMTLLSPEGNEGGVRPLQASFLVNSAQLLGDEDVPEEE